MITDPKWHMRPVIWVLEKVMGLASWRDWFSPEINDDTANWVDPRTHVYTFTATAPWFVVSEDGSRTVTFTDGTTLDIKRNGESVVKW
ncbi:hypothetical protein [Mycobacteroides salmoniphilum]|uniref:hypothetical protein n=1 Tax=Mycobacteroides salmoniphilum TaxID=404941 RepID=UPI0012FFAD4C|nr:hypothetical protein [Mycobacteroides salmoniphilum]